MIVARTCRNCVHCRKRPNGTPVPDRICTFDGQRIRQFDACRIGQWRRSE